MNKAIRTAAVLCLAAAAFAHADEGMWLLDAPPAAELKSKYNFAASPEWLNHMQKSAVRFQTGGSGSIVSKDGLVMTNHHVGSDMLLKLSTPENNLLEKGYFAATRDAELKCPDLELNVLWESRDVTDLVQAGAKNASDPAAAAQARRKAISTIEKESLDKTGLKSEVVTLFNGGKYYLYQYKSYTDVRLVFAPEEKIAFFGGDTDNFEFPRFNLDCCFFRIYDQGKPLAAEHHLTWSENGAAENELIFVVGHPGRTRRLHTTAHLEFLRDFMMPLQLSNLWRSEVRTQTFMARNAENARTARDLMAGIANTRKAYTGLLAGLQDPRLIATKQEAEESLRSRVAKDAEKQAQWGDAWDQLRTAEEIYLGFFDRKYTIDRVATRGSGLLSRAIDIVRLADELPKPSSDRLREYSDASLDSLYLALYSPEPLPDALEIEQLTSGLARMAEMFGADDELVSLALAGKSPRDRAVELVAGCTLKDPQARKDLVKGGAKAVAASKDPMIDLARLLDAESRDLRTLYEDEVESVERDAYAKIAAAQFWAFGDKVYPDATFTLRLAYGTVKGSPQAPKPFTDLAGLYQRAADREGQQDFDLPESWIAKKDALNLATPFNFTCTADIIGGNSGSPVVNAKGQIVGLIFDGNLDSLVGDVVYDDQNARAVAVDSRGLMEALTKIYDATSLVSELTAK